ncbi:MAG: tRNA (N(6)-L-threonylcarbamoyladenosine(37)-C(2))-methylthiotransferase MtaB, partial [Planctomycetes bacterium]|nr:tRNA (N(6)-L-threonylcarbamoyladenosine(37)-C(2))-methylthiotransferase MtaB [Planctomycetota bacterium]
FPGETDEDFEETMTLARQVQFSKVHVFSYSPRKGTPAAIMPNQINPEVIKKRSQKLRNLDKKLQKDFRNSFKGQKVEIITESTNPTTGRTKRYFKAELTNQKQAKPGDLVTGILD